MEGDTEDNLNKELPNGFEQLYVKTLYIQTAENTLHRKLLGLFWFFIHVMPINLQRICSRLPCFCVSLLSNYADDS